MGYILDLRKQIGHQPLLMTSACVLVLNEQNQLLLQHRTDNGYWSYPGGSLELGESFEACAKREVFEETGLLCKELTFFTTASGEHMHYVYPNKDEVYIAEVVYICREYEGELRVQEEEASEQYFFDLAHLPENISPVNIDVIHQLIMHMQEQV